jgi:hypothetical protein
MSVPVDVVSVLSDLRGDALTVAVGFLVAGVSLGAFRMMRRGAGGAGGGGGAGPTQREQIQQRRSGESLLAYGERQSRMNTQRVRRHT